jgi:hypothetical protein
MRPGRTVRAALLAATAIGLLAVGPALAGRPVFREHLSQIDDTFPETLCDPDGPLGPLEGIDVTTHVSGTTTITVRLDAAGHELLKVTRLRQTVFTNEDGDDLILLESGQARDASIVDNTDGTTSFTFRVAGRPELLILPDGQKLVFDRGLIVVRDTFDFNDPLDPNDDVLVSSELLHQAGPHPEADSGFAAFCETVEQVLG